MTVQRHLLLMVDRVAGAFGALDRELCADELLEQAREKLGDIGFDVSAIAEPLRVLLRAYMREANLSVVGRAAVRWDINRFLSNLARLQAQEQLCPEIRQEAVEQPIFVTGLPRSGTSFLFRLLAEDPRHRAPLCWETLYPYPDRGDPQPDPRASRVTSQLRAFARLAPEFPRLHPFGATSPQECTEITAHVFRSLRFDTPHHIPSYRRWLDQDGHLEAYRFHKRFLQHLQHQDRPATARRWVLKAPEHVFALTELLAVYPDARIVFVHRDPLKVLPSVARLTEVLRAPFTRRQDRTAIGCQVSEDWGLGALRMVEADRALATTGRIVHVHYGALIARPFDTVGMIYRALDMDFAPAAMTSIKRLIQRDPRGGYGQNRYEFAPYGLDPAQERARFRRYVAHFGVEVEVDAPANVVGVRDAVPVT